MKSLKGQFLIAAGSLVDPNFSRSVVLVVQHDGGGALGVVVNRPLDLTVRAACEQALGVDCAVDGPLYQGGPVEQRILFALFAGDDGHGADDADADGHAVAAGLRFTSDKDAIEQLLRAPPAGPDGDPGVKLIIGYSGWAAGQLEGEMQTGSWLTVPATAARALGPAGPLWGRLVTEANLGKFVDPKWIPDDPSVN